MIIESIKSLFIRDLNKLKKEIGLYKNEANLWILENEIKNTGGNLAYHLIGNLKHFIGSVIGNSGYVRQRDLEFSSRDIPRESLLKEIDETIQVIEKTLSEMDASDLEKPYPINVFGHNMTTGYFLIHLTTHLSYHLGQINYHRRLLDN